MNISGFFALGGVILSAGKETEALGPLVTLGPMITSFVADGSLDSALGSLNQAEVDAVGDLWKIIGGLVIDPKHGGATLAAIKSIEGASS